MSGSGPSPRRPPRQVGGSHRVPAWAPNALTGLRIALIPAFVAHAWWCRESVASGGPDQPHRALALAALLGIGLSDVADGWLARRFGLATPFGAVLDALADKLAQVSLLLFFALVPGGSLGSAAGDGAGAFVHVPLVFVALLLGRDVLLALGSLAVRRRRGRVAVVHEPHGKLASLLLFALLVWITADLPRGPVTPALWTIGVLVTLSTAAYVRAGWRQWRAGERTRAR